ncbi:MAG: hypothetical protein JXM70_06815 [Pirellulales bacterium]|nr:hypothetical protein [Pirellulales bacterium]
MTNYFTDPVYRQVVRDMSVKMVEYGKKYNDPRIANARIRADLDWAIRDQGPYRSHGTVDGRADSLAGK